ncbi:HNH endonuclease [Bacillus sp. MCCB 382]|uniref:HNH endonuclease n=1 Tax=Bacillus sp. MCCB 382 TaxID=2860197 RepID=UPI001C5997F9|nr:HNH endonuclease [Bacillus sp. MCCB 382]
MPKKHSIEFIREQFRSHGYTLISNEYRGMRYSLEYKCDKHPEAISRMSYGNLNAGHRCKYCKAEERRHSIEDVRRILAENGCKLVSEEYFGNAKPLDYRCLNHPEEVQTSTLNNIQQRRGCPKCARELLSQKYRGENHHCWKGGFHTESQRARRTIEYANWRKKVFEKDNFTCQCCGDNTGGNLEAHHILNFSNNHHQRFEVDNGITMCRNCHNPKISGSFHNTFGTKSNDFTQLEEYFKGKGTYFKGAFSINKTLKGVLDKWQEE